MVVSLAIDHDGTHPEEVVILGCHWMLSATLNHGQALSLMVNKYKSVFRIIIKIIHRYRYCWYY